MKRYKKTGFTLIETIVAFAIIAVILVVALVGFNTISNINNRAQSWNAADEDIEALIAGGKDKAVSFSEESLKFSIENPRGTDAPFDIEIKGYLLTFNKDGKTIEIFQAK